MIFGAADNFSVEYQIAEINYCKYYIHGKVVKLNSG